MNKNIFNFFTRLRSRKTTTANIRTCLPLLAGALSLNACMQAPVATATEIQAVKVWKADTITASLSLPHAANLQGISNLDIRPRVEGYLTRILVDEGQFVQAGQRLFQIDQAPFLAQLNKARAAVLTAKANLRKQKSTVGRLQPLVDAKVISAIQLEDAHNDYDGRVSDVAAAESAEKSAEIDYAFTTITAPVTGYIGHLNFKIGSLVGHSESDPLTTLSDIHRIRAYFTLSEKEFLDFKSDYAGQSIEEKIRKVPPVSLVLPDNSTYADKGKLEIIEGQFDPNTGGIRCRASFSNPGGLLRSGNTAKVLMSRRLRQVFEVPINATFELQNRIMAFIVTPAKKLKSVILTVADRNGNDLYVSGGLRTGDQLVISDPSLLRDDQAVKISAN